MKYKLGDVQKALIKKTEIYGNTLTLTRDINKMVHSGRYALKDVITGKVYAKSYKTLKDVVIEFNLKF